MNDRAWPEARTAGLLSLLIGLFLAAGCSDDGSGPEDSARRDGAYRLQIPVSGSLQNPAWSPDGHYVLFTRFREGYNREPADLLAHDTGSGATRTVVSDGSGNVNLPGSCWSGATAQIVFSSSREPHDEIYVIDENGLPGDERRLTQRQDEVAYEPSFSPDGQWVVFESHGLDVEDDGVITKFRIDGSEEYMELTAPGEDCRQPNWSPAGDFIVYQSFASGRWDIWVTDPDGATHRQVTSGAGDKTDASFSPDGHWIVYSSDEGELESANLFVVPVSGGDASRLTNHDGYDGAPSWSPDGRRIAFESCPGDPDESAGTTLWVIDAPEY
jgi:TolB protein